MNEKKTDSKRGFAADPQRASEAGKTTKSRQSPEERTRMARLAAKARWEKYRRDGLAYEDPEKLNAGEN